jgi:hypothetical protein
MDVKLSAFSCVACVVVVGVSNIHEDPHQKRAFRP